MNNNFCSNCGTKLENSICNNCNASNEKNVPAIIGFCFGAISIAIAPLMILSLPFLILSIIGLKKSKKCNGNGKEISIVGIILNSFGLFVFMFFMFIFVGVVFFS